MNEGIVFGRGFLGKRIACELNFFLPDFNIIAGDYDNRKKLEEILDKEKPNVVVNAVGKTNYNWCENYKNQAENSNVNVPLQLARQCSERGIYFVHIGTGNVYNYCNRRMYTEEDEPNFVADFYTKTKIKAEKKLKEKSEQDSNSKILQIRVAYPLDYVENDKNLLTKILNHKRALNSKHSITVVPDMINALGILIKKKSLGVYNVVNNGIISVADIMEMYNNLIDNRKISAKKLEFEAITMNEFEKANLRKRSLCFLSAKKLMDEGIVMPCVCDSVENCLIKYMENLQKF